MITCVRKFSIDAGHRLMNHEGKCKCLHGHTYTFEVYARTFGSTHLNNLDSIGRVVDFSVLKDRIGNWLEDNWDHGLILNEKDPLVQLFLTGLDLSPPQVPDQKLYLLAVNPTAENLAWHLLQESNSMMSSHKVEVHKVVCHETPKCFAIAEL